MKPLRAKELLPIITAFAEGKTIQYRYPGDSHYTELAELGDLIHSYDLDVNNYRIKPTPTLRPWRPEEVPVGAIVRDPKYNSVWLITALWEQHKGSGDYRVFLNGGNYEGHKLEYFTDDKMLYSPDHGKTWLPCGVVTD